MSARTISKVERLKIGNTPLIRCPKLEQQYGISNLLIKDESQNPFGTFKDRRNKLAIHRAIEEHVDKMVLITSGNAGYSLARLAEDTGIKVVCIVDKTINPKVRKHLDKYSYRVVEVDLSREILKTEDVIELARETSDEVIWDVTNGYHAAFQSIIMEIKEEAPAWLLTPLGSGEAYVGLNEGLKKCKLKTTLVGAGVHQLRDHELELHNGPSIADKLYTPYTPYKRRITAILREGNLYVSLLEEEIRNAYERINSMISCEPSSAAAFAALPKLEIGRDDKVVVINSGKGALGK